MVEVVDRWLISQALQRITTEYIDAEDRFRLSGEVENSPSVMIWLTRRLLQRLLPALLEWLERQGAGIQRAEVLQSFAQQAAQAELTPQPAVLVGVESASWLVSSIDLVRSEQSLSMTFRGAGGQSATLTMEAKQLRQWLSIMHDMYIKAEWPVDIWPDWLREAVAPGKQQSVVLH